MHNETAGYTLSNADSVTFEEVFKSSFKSLHLYACSILKEESAAEEVVQQVFFKLWEKNERLSELQSITAYLYRAVHNDCLNVLKHSKVKAAHRAHALYTSSEHDHPADQAALKELQRNIDKAINELPEQCRTIFQMSRFEDMKYRDIAEKLGLSVKTVENQMGKALRVLRNKLGDYLPMVALFLVNALIVIQ